MIIFEVVVPISVVFFIIYVAITEHNKATKWADKFKEGMKVYSNKEAEGVIICIKGNKAFVKFFHGNYWMQLDDLIPYNEYLEG